MKKSRNILLWTDRQLKILLNKTRDAVLYEFVKHLLEERALGNSSLVEMNENKFVQHIRELVSSLPTDWPEEKFFPFHLVGSISDERLAKYIDRVLVTYPGSIVEEGNNSHIFHVAWSKVLREIMKKAHWNYSGRSAVYEIESALCLRNILEVEVDYSKMDFMLGKLVLTVSKSMKCDLDLFTEKLHLFKKALAQKFWLFEEQRGDAVNYSAYHKFVVIQEALPKINFHLNDYLQRQQNNGHKNPGTLLKSQLVKKFPFLSEKSTHGGHTHPLVGLKQSGNLLDISNQVTREEINEVLVEILLTNPEAKIVEEPTGRFNYSKWVINLNRKKVEKLERRVVIFSS